MQVVGARSLDNSAVVMGFGVSVVSMPLSMSMAMWVSMGLRIGARI